MAWTFLHRQMELRAGENSWEWMSHHRRILPAAGEQTPNYRREYASHTSVNQLIKMLTLGRLLHSGDEPIARAAMDA